jgi:hypothetical protein
MKTLNLIIGTQAFRASIAVVALVGGAQMASADFIPYSPSGSINPTTYSFTATDTGSIKAYFAGSSAADNDGLAMIVGNPVGYNLSSLNFVLFNNNPASAIGQSTSLGHVTAGDTLTFVLYNQATGNYFFSNPALNSDKDNHIYSTAYTAAAGIPIPNGTYVAFEDLLNPGTDNDYNDESFVFKNVTRTPGAATTVVPEPTTIVAGALLLLPLGVSTLRILRNRKAQ